MLVNSAFMSKETIFLSEMMFFPLILLANPLQSLTQETFYLCISAKFIRDFESL